MSGIDDLITGILKREGGYVDNPADRGGPTNFGITAATLSDWRHAPVTALDVASMKEDEARTIYRTKYVSEPRFDKITDPDLQELVVDAGVNSGPRQATRWLQAAVGVVADGVLGAGTEAAIGNADTRRIRALVTASRVRSYGHLISSDHAQAVFAAGWLDRAASFVEKLA